MIRTCAFLAISFCLVGLSCAICPREENLKPFCECNELGFACVQSGSNTKPWEIKEYFEKLSSLIPEDIVYEQLRLEKTNLKEIPAGTFDKFKFSNFSIIFNPKLEFVHPDAFGASYETAMEMGLSSNPLLTNDGSDHTVYDAFNVLNKFKRLQYLYFFDNSITSLPDNAFGTHPELQTLILSYEEFAANLKTIGKRVFSGLPNLVDLRLASANISLEKIDDGAFEGMGENVEMYFVGNPIERLPEKIFKPVLDNVRKLYVGGHGVEMNCDDVSAWICADVLKYKNVLEGFLCRPESGFKDIFEYCENGKVSV